MTVDTALEFYKRCNEQNADTEEKRMDILTALAREGRMESVIATGRSKDQVVEDLKKNYGNILHVKKRRPEGD